MEPRKPKPRKPRAESEPPLAVEGGETDEAAPQPATSDAPGGMIGEGGRSPEGGEGGMIGEG
jgi:hypothetical protein